MTKKVYKGWLAKSVTAEVLHWVSASASGSPFLDIFMWRKVYRFKHEKETWGEGTWPPKRVTITVEIED